jgi:hypothetical protein
VLVGPGSRIPATSEHVDLANDDFRKRARVRVCCAGRVRSAAARLGFVRMRCYTDSGPRSRSDRDERTTPHLRCPWRLALLDAHGNGGHAAAGGLQCNRLWEFIPSGQPRTNSRPKEATRDPLVIDEKKGRWPRSSRSDACIAQLAWVGSDRRASRREVNCPPRPQRDHGRGANNIAG